MDKLILLLESLSLDQCRDAQILIDKRIKSLAQQRTLVDDTVQ